MSLTTGIFSDNLNEKATAGLDINSSDIYPYNRTLFELDKITLILNLLHTKYASNPHDQMTTAYFRFNSVCFSGARIPEAKSRAFIVCELDGQRLADKCSVVLANRTHR